MTRRRPLRVAFIGCRGVPATYGGVEHHVEEIARRLALRGHEVTVFCRPGYVDPPYDDYQGIHRRAATTVSTKHLDAIVHSIFASLAALRGFDVVHYHAVGPGLTAPIVRFGSKTAVVLTVHGLDSQRGKWGAIAKTVLRVAEWMSARIPHSTVVVSEDLERYYGARFSRAAERIHNGVNVRPPLEPGTVLKELELDPGKYILFVGRLVPEKAPDVLIEAFKKIDAGVPLVLVGPSSFTDDYVRELQGIVGTRNDVIFAGPRYGEELAELYSNAALFVLPSLLEGLPLTLLEAVSYGIPVIASTIAPHMEILRSDGPGRRLVPPGDPDALGRALLDVLARVDLEREASLSARDALLREYTWDAAVDAHEELYARLVNGASTAEPRNAEPIGIAI